MKYTKDFIILLSIVFVLTGCGTAGVNQPINPQVKDSQASGLKPLRIAVMDPLAAPLARPCVPGYARRNYELLGKFLEEKLKTSVKIFYGKNFGDIRKQHSTEIDLVIAKDSEFRYDASKMNLGIRPLAMLTDKEGLTTTRGLFTVRKDYEANEISKLYKKRIIFGPERSEETSSAALWTASENYVLLQGDPETMQSSSASALEVIEKKADAAVISAYALPLLEGCNTIEKGSLKILGTTDEVPFITVYAVDSLPYETSDMIVDALLSIKDNRFLAGLESKDGFVSLVDPRCVVREYWTDWRGPRRDGISPYLPQSLPDKPKYRWKSPLSGEGLSGLAIADKYLVLSDKDFEKITEIWRCFDADSGEQIWQHSYECKNQTDHTNCPGANPVIDLENELVYTLGSKGDLRCLNLRSGMLKWKINIIDDFKAKLPEWGTCSSPLIVGNKLIVNPGAPDASIIALDRMTGEPIWKMPGNEQAYSSFICKEIKGKKQVIGYDAASILGIDPETGKKLWQILPEHKGDLNVPAPIIHNGKLIVSTEKNGTGIYGFDNNGIVIQKPEAKFEDLAPHSQSPVVYNSMLFGASGGKMYCLDVANGLKLLWSKQDDIFEHYTSLIAGNGHILATSVTGRIILIKASPEKYTEVGRLRLYEDTEIWSHPLVQNNRMYIRSMKDLRCLALNDEPGYVDFINEFTLFDGSSLDNWKETDFFGTGGIKLQDGSIIIKRGHDMTGINWTGPLLRMNYEISLEASRQEGSDFFCGLTFPVGKDPCTFISGGWGGMLIGLSNIDHYDAANNETSSSYNFKNNQWYRIRVRVTDQKIQCWIDDNLKVDLETEYRSISVRFEVEPSRPLGIATWQTTGAVRNIKVKRVTEPSTDELVY